jgi:anaerobic ribonucleoside-triphosphate reductase activating protein
MNFANLLENDIADSISGICVSLWFFGCNHFCRGCQNSELWDVTKAPIRDNDDVVSGILNALTKNNVKRGLSILGGEPFMKENRADCAYIIKEVLERVPDLTVYIWSGSTYEELLAENDENISYILSHVKYLIDGPYIESLRDTRLKLRGSSNQRVLLLKDGKIEKDISYD